MPHTPAEDLADLTEEHILGCSVSLGHLHAHHNMHTSNNHTILSIQDMHLPTASHRAALFHDMCCLCDLHTLHWTSQRSALLRRLSQQVATANAAY
jgi:hypothetical protein